MRTDPASLIAFLFYQYCNHFTNRKYSSYTFTFMIKNYLTSVLRYISRNKVFSTINVLGLAIGMMACMLIMQYVLHEFSYDNFHSKKDRIVRLQLDRYNKGEISTRWASGALGIGPDLKANFPEVETIVRLRNNNAVFSYQDLYFKEEGVYYASEDFFKVFSFDLVVVRLVGAQEL